MVSVVVVSFGEDIAIRAQIITEHERVGRVLCDGEARFRALLEFSYDVIYQMNPDRQETRYLDGSSFISNKRIFELEHRIL
jgi:hypothetical protein